MAQAGVRVSAHPDAILRLVTQDVLYETRDQPWQPRLREGMVRACLVEGRVAGFGIQAVNVLHADAPLPGFQ